MKTGLIITAIVIVLIVLGGFFILNNRAPAINPSNNETANTGNSNNAIEVDITNFDFSPENLTIKQGQTVIWTNKDAVKHTVTSDSGIELLSDALSKDQTYSHTFNQKGTYNYHCNLHSSMKGFVIVQ